LTIFISTAIIFFMYRIKEHPVLTNDPGKTEWVRFYLDGKELEGKRGEPIAAALMAAGITGFRHTYRLGEPRGMFCGIGQCQECSMVVNGVPNVRTCVTPLEEGMKVYRQKGRGRMEKW
jgi:predicted molibdopterin-dependent oxidoreductase YjgC